MFDAFGAMPRAQYLQNERAEKTICPPRATILHAPSRCADGGNKDDGGMTIAGRFSGAGCSAVSGAARFGPSRSR
jgi:hypothetical protein